MFLAAAIFVLSPPQVRSHSFLHAHHVESRDKANHVASMSEAADFDTFDDTREAEGAEEELGKEDDAEARMEDVQSEANATKAQSVDGSDAEEDATETGDMDVQSSGSEQDATETETENMEGQSIDDTAGSADESTQETQNTGMDTQSVDADAKSSTDKDTGGDIQTSTKQVEADEAEIIDDASDNERAESDEEEFETSVMQDADGHTADASDDEEGEAHDSGEDGQDDSRVEDGETEGGEDTDGKLESDEGENDQDDDDDDVKDAAQDIEDEDAQIESESRAEEEAGRELDDISGGLNLGGSFSILPSNTFSISAPLAKPVPFHLIHPKIKPVSQPKGSMGGEHPTRPKKAVTAQKLPMSASELGSSSIKEPEEGTTAGIQRMPESTSASTRLNHSVRKTTASKIVSKLPISAKVMADPKMEPAPHLVRLQSKPIGEKNMTSLTKHALLSTTKSNTMNVVKAAFELKDEDFDDDVYVDSDTSDDAGNSDAEAEVDDEGHSEADVDA